MNHTRSNTPYNLLQESYNQHKLLIDIEIEENGGMTRLESPKRIEKNVYGITIQNSFAIYSHPYNQTRVTVCSAISYCGCKRVVRDDKGI